MNKSAKWIGWILFLAMVWPAAAQVQVGDNLTMNLNGQLSAGYTADYGNQIPSDHGVTFGGNADLTGSYYDPNFLNFNINPFWGQSKLNSTYASNSLASGVNATANIFSGSKFPGSVNFSKIYNSDGTIGIPGSLNYATNGNSTALGVGWGAYLPNLPSLSVNYQQGSNDYSVYGENGDSTNHSRTFNVHSGYQFAGFQLNAGFQHSTSNSEFPAIFGDPETSDSSGNSYSAAIAHQLPLHGNVSFNFNRSDFDSTYGLATSSGLTTYNGSVDTFSTSAYINPIDHLSIGSNATYSDNLLGSLFQNVITAGGQVQVVVPGETTHSLDVTGYGNYALSKHWALFGSLEYRNQTNLQGGILAGNSIGQDISSEVATGTATYTGEFKGGVVSGLVGLQQNKVNTFNSSGTVGLISSGSYSKEIGAWALAGGFNYSQNTQTVLVGYTTSNMGYAANMLHKMGRFRWSATVGGSKSLLNSTGYSTFAQNYSTSVSGKWFGVNAGYNKSSGNALLAGSGLVPTPIPSVLLPSQLVFYGGEGWSLGMGANPIRKLALSASYGQSHSDTSSTLTPYSYNHNENMVFTVQYQVRQLYFNAGYIRLVQGFSASTTPPAMLGTWYVGIQRWFNFF